jgi:hypothetical protein
MSGRVVKSTARNSTQYRLERAEFIRHSGFESRPCDRCKGANRACFVSFTIGRCDGCFAAGRSCVNCPRVAMSSCGFSCPLSIPVLALLIRFLVERINSELRRLASEEEAAEELLLERQRQFEESQRKISEALARLSRLRKMQRSLKSKGVEMLRRELSSLEELEEEERKEAEEKARKEALERAQQQEVEALAQMQQACASEVIDWSGVEISDASLSDFLGNVAQGDFGGTPSTGAERSSGA